MFTYFVYSFVLFGSSANAYISSISRTPTQKRVFLFFSFFIPFIFLALRYDISFDYHNYVYIFYQIADGHPGLREPLFVLINQAISFLGLDVQWLFVFFAFWTLYFVYKAIPREVLPTAIFLYVAMCYLYDDMDIMRQGLAVPMMMHAMKFVYQKRFMPYVLYALLAMGIHFFTGIVFLMVYPILRVNYNRYVLMTVIVVAYLVLIKLSLLEIALKFSANFFPKVAMYLQSSFANNAHLGTGIGVIIKIFFALFAIAYKDVIVSRYSNAYIFINLYILYIVAMLLHLKLAIFMRIEEMFVFGMIVSLSYLVAVMQKYDKIIVAFIVLAFHAMGYYKYIGQATRENIYEHLSVVNPYKTIFERGDSIRVRSLRSGTGGK